MFVALLPPLFLITSAAAVREKNRLRAWIFVAPSLLETLWVPGVVLFYQVR